jgi:PAS domain S-box-containing protein
MKFLKEENIAKANFVSSVIIVLLLSIALISSFTLFHYRNISHEQKKIETAYILSQKERIKTIVDNTISRFMARKLFAQKENRSELKDRVTIEGKIADTIIRILNTSKKNKKDTEYVFIVKLHDINGGKEYGTMLVNPNLPELVGKKLSDSYKGAHGKEFVKEMLKGIRADGEAFVSYWLRKPGSDKPSPKITYWKLFPDWQWIVGKGIYLNDLENILSQKKTEALKEIKQGLILMIILCLGFVAGAIGLAYLFSRSINTLFSGYKIRQIQQQKDLHKFDLIINQAHDGIAIADLRGIYTYVNLSMAKMHGYEPDEIIGRHLSIFHTPEQMSNEVMPITKKVLKKGFHSGEVSHLHKDGSLFPTTTSATLLFNEKKEPEGVIGIVIDVSQIVLAKQKAEEANLAKSTFLANMSHEIRTPMNGILGMTRLALETSLSNEQRRFLENVHISAKGLLRLLNDILDFSKIEAGQLLMESHDFNMTVMLDNIRSMLFFDAQRKGLTLHMVIADPGLPDFVRGDELRISQILVNLIGNGIKFTKEGSVTVRVSFKEMPDKRLEFYFSVSDTGMGVPLARQKDIFNSFSQADASTARQFGGTGLGLAITKQLVQMMGGNIRLDSTEGQGATFYFTIVLLPGDKKNMIQQKKSIKSGLKNLNVLLVEDNEINRDLAQMVLTKGQCHVLTAENGLEALKILTEKQVDLILMDIQMPVMDGITATKIIRGYEKGSIENENLPNDLDKKLSMALSGVLSGHHLPIIAMTANAMEGDRGKSLAAGMDAYLTKPFIPEDVFKAIAQIDFLV